jgi:glycosyltransferase involved in cell wall biosynthesis
MRILHVIPSLETEASGGSYFVGRLCDTLAAQPHEVSVMSVGALSMPFREGVEHAGFRHDYDVPVLRRLYVSKELKRTLKRRASDFDVIHTNSLWVMPNVYPGIAAKNAGVPFIFSPHGTLGDAPLKVSRFRKKVFWKLVQEQAVQGAACYHATCEAEYNEIRDAGLLGPVAIIPIGIDIPPPAKTDEGKGPRRLLYLSRIDPKKALPELLQAWKLVSSHHNDWELRIVGPDERGHRSELELIAAELGVERVTFESGVFGQEKQNEYSKADLFILASHHENFGITVAEALAAGTPVIVSTKMPWSGVVSHGCGWQVQPTVGAIAGVLSEAMIKPSKRLREMGEAGRAWMICDYSWSAIGREYERLYAWVSGRGPRPDSVKL